MAPWLNQFKVSPGAEIRENHFCYCSFIHGGHMLQHDLLKTWSPSVLSLQLTASPPARTVDPAAGQIPACVAQASRGPAVRRWLRSRCTSVTEAPWGASNPGPTPSRKTNHGEGPQKGRPSIPPRSRPRDLRPPGSLSTLRKWCSCASLPLLITARKSFAKWGTGNTGKILF